ncbi:MAG: hypothetical protein WB471_14540, partial [Nocardioides sp.]
MSLGPRPERRPSERARRLRVALPASLAVALVAAAFALPSSEDAGTLTLRQENEVIKADRGQPHVDPAGSPLHSHDPAFKNAISRGGEALSAETADPTSAVEARDAAAYVAS